VIVLSSFNPIHLITRAHLSWFNRGLHDARYLERWRAQPLVFAYGTTPIGAGWHSDAYDECILPAASAAQFAHAADLLLRYQFYPRDVMRHTSDFGVALRQMRVGDRLVQRIPVITLLGMAGVDVMTMNEIVAVEQDARRVGFAYITTQAHSEQGIWSAHLEWRADASLWLSVRATSRPNPREPRLIHPLMRYMQKRSHRRGIEHFRGLVSHATTQN
jgi:uncharacterized protein (UPF0548 family)